MVIHTRHINERSFLPLISTAMSLSCSCVKQERGSKSKISIELTDVRGENQKSLFYKVCIVQKCQLLKQRENKNLLDTNLFILKQTPIPWLSRILWTVFSIVDTNTLLLWIIITAFWSTMKRRSDRSLFPLALSFFSFFKSNRTFNSIVMASFKNISKMTVFLSGIGYRVLNEI